MPKPLKELIRDWDRTFIGDMDATHTLGVEMKRRLRKLDEWTLGPSPRVPGYVATEDIRRILDGEEP